MVGCSPPYWGLRNYGIAGQLGLEPTPDAYIESMMAVMAEVWRVLRDDGVCFVNLGDSYITNPGNGRGGGHPGDGGMPHWSEMDTTCAGLQAKNLALIPARFSLAVQSAGWIVRQDIIWSKPNPMPESVRDRPTTSHEHVFLLAKAQRYFYDQDAIREVSSPTSAGNRNEFRGGGTYTGGNSHNNSSVKPNATPGNDNQPAGRNCRSVWTIVTQPYKGAHFATFPEKLVQRMVKAGTSEKGCCPECGAQWGRVVDRSKKVKMGWTTQNKFYEGSGGHDGLKTKMVSVPETIGWQPTCSHDHEPVPATVLDPFVGSGTTVKVARELGRRAVGLDLSGEYLKLAQKRNQQMTLWEDY
jgi:DNA modification methylase